MDHATPQDTASETPWRRREVLFLVAVLAAALLVRCWALDADPGINQPGGSLSDWGSWWKNARQHALWGAWRRDDYNIAFYLAPVYTLVLRGLFALAGVGMVQARLLSALAGLATVVIIHRTVRSWAGPRAALVAALLASLDPYAMLFDRSAYPESLANTAMVASVALLLDRSPRWPTAALAGLLVPLVAGVKVAALPFVPIPPLILAVLALGARPLGLPSRPSNARIAAFIAGMALAGGIMLAFVLVNRAPILAHLHNSLAEGAAPTAVEARSRLQLLPFLPFGFYPGPFFRREWFLFAALGVLGALRLSRILRRRVTALEVACWVWIVASLAALSLVGYQPPRRFLLLMPPAVMLAGCLLGDAWDIAPSPWRSTRWRAAGWAAAGAVAGSVLCFYLAPLAAWRAQAGAARIGVDWSYAEAGSHVFQLGVLVCALAGLVLATRLPRARLRGTAWIAIAAAAWFGFVWTGQMHHRSHGMRDTARLLERLTRSWPDSDRVAAGWPAPTLVMGTDLLGVSMELSGAPAGSRFRPGLELYVVAPGREPRRSPLFAVPGEPGKVLCALLPAWTDVAGRPRFMVHVFVRPDRQVGCPAGHNENGAAGVAGRPAP